MATTEAVSFTSNGFKLVGKLFFPDSGMPAPALIISHGAGHFKESYFELAEYLARHGVAAFAVDMCGHGESEGPRFHCVIKQWVSDVRAAVDFLSKHPRIDSSRIAGYGISSGGTAVLEAALIDPRLKALIAMDATVRNSLPFAMTAIVKTFHWLGKVKKAVTGKDLRIPLGKMGPMHLASDPEINAKLVADPKTMEALNAFPFPGATEAFFVDTIKRVPDIKVPTLVIWGEDDKLDPPETGKLLFAALTCKKQLEIVPGNGHAGHVDRNKAKVFALTADWVLGNLQAAARAAAA